MADGEGNGGGAAQEIEFLFTGDTKSLDAAVESTSHQTQSVVDQFGKVSHAADNTAAHTHGLGDEFLHAKEHAKGLGVEVGEHLPEGFEKAIRQMVVLDNSTSMLTEAFELLTSPLGLAVAGVGALAAIDVGSALTLVEMAEGASTLGERLFEMSRKTGVSVENLHALDVGTKLAGTSVERIVQAITMLEFRMQRSQGATKGAGKALADLHLDSQDANHALEQLFEHLSTIPEGMQRTQEAMKLMGPRMGRDFSLVVDEMGGDIEKFKKTMEDKGIEITAVEAEMAHTFHQNMVIVEEQWENLKRQIEMTATPMVISWLQEISAWLTDNKGKIIEWGKEFVGGLGRISENFVPLVAEKFIEVTKWVNDNKEEIISWGQEAVNSINTITKTVGGLIDTLEALKAVSPINIEINIIRKISDAAGLTEGFGEIKRDVVDPAIAHREWAQELKRKGYSDWEIWTRSFRDLPSALDLNPPEAVPTPDMDVKPAKMPPPPSPPSPGKTGKHKGGGGEDPYKIEIELEKERLKQSLAGFQHEEDQWTQMQKDKLVSMELYTNMSLQIEKSRSEATLASLNSEIAAAAHIKKPGEREKKELELAGQVAAEKYRLEKVVADKLYALQEEELARDRAREEGKTAINEAVAQQEKDRITDLASRRIETEESAARQIVAIDDGLLDAKEQNLKTHLALEKSGSSQYIAIQQQLGLIETQRTANAEAAQRKYREGREKDLEDARRFVSEIRRMDQEIFASKVNTARAILQHSVATGAESDPNRIRNLQAALDAEEENARFAQQMYELHEQARVELKNQTYDRILVINDRYLKLEEAAEEAHNQKLLIVNERYYEELHAALSNLATTASTTLADSITQGFEHGVKAGVRSFEAGVLDMIKSAAMRELQKEVLAIFDNLAGRGGIVGKIFEILTGVKKGSNPNQTTGVGSVIPNAPTITDPAIVAATANAQKIAATIDIATVTQTRDLQAATTAQTQQIDASIARWAEHLCECSQPAQQGFLSSVLGAALGGAISGSLGGGKAGGNRANEGPDTGPVKIKPVLKGPGRYEGGNFGPNQEFDVGEYGPEKVITSSSGFGFVVPNSQQRSNTRGGGDKVINLTMNAPVLGASNYSTPKSRREYLEMLAPALRDALDGI